MKRFSIMLATALTVLVTSAGAQDIGNDNLDAENEAQRDKILALLGTDPDEDTLPYAVVREPEHGVLEGTAPDVRYVPGENFEGTDSFAFVVDDGETSVPALTSEPAEVVIDVLPAPDDPTLSIEFKERKCVNHD